ncbi:MAG TPA: ABC transporter ATP-binding protein [Candidatus Limnocylindria bacterium]|nr:ABC transporter ATP-binding protein [Candidatus Limnocylindria bacterium]
MAAADQAGSGSGLAVRVSDLDVTFPAGTEAVRGLTLDVEPGSFTAIIGPNGCGKSTLLRVLAGLLRPTSGGARLGEQPPRAGDGRVGLAFQQPRLIPWLSTLDNVALPLSLHGDREAKRRAERALAQVGLTGAADLKPRQLSGGMAQRAALARALISDPPLLLLDEPFSALDALTREAFDSELQRLWMHERRSVVLVTHSVGEAIRLADRIVVMTPRPGRVAATIDVDLPRPRETELTGNPRAAAIEAQVRAALAAPGATELAPWVAA